MTRSCKDWWNWFDRTLANANGDIRQMALQCQKDASTFYRAKEHENFCEKTGLPKDRISENATRPLRSKNVDASEQKSVADKIKNRLDKHPDKRITATVVKGFLHESEGVVKPQKKHTFLPKFEPTEEPEKFVPIKPHATTKITDNGHHSITVVPQFKFSDCKCAGCVHMNFCFGAE